MVRSKLFRKTLVVFLAILVFGSFSLNVMGATYTTTTTYDIGAGAISVVSQVTGAAPNEEIAYLAYKGENPAAFGAIVYIDQDTADATGTKTFTYSTTRDDFITATVKFGGNMSEGFTPSGAGDDVLPGYRAVNFTVYGNGSVEGVTLVNGSGTLYVPKNANTTFNFVADTGSVLENIIVNDEIIEFISPSYVVGPVADESEGDVEIKLFFVEVDATGSVTTADEGTNEVVYSGTNDDDSSENFVQVLASTNVGSDYEYGVAYALKSDFSDQVLYRAYGRGNTGLYIVKLVNGGKSTIKSGTTFYARSYVKHIPTGEITYGETVTIVVE